KPQNEHLHSGSNYFRPESANGVEAYFCNSSSAASTWSLCAFTSTSFHTLRTIPSGPIKNVCLAESFVTPRFMIESYFSETSFLLSDSNLKIRPSFAQNS